MAVSHAVEWKSSGSKLLEVNCMPMQIIGGTPSIQAKHSLYGRLCLNGVFVTEDFYKKKCHPTCGHVKRWKQMLTLRAANRLEIPYMGYLKQEIEVDGVRVPNYRALLLKDNPATSQQRNDILNSLEPMFWCRSPGLIP